MYYFLSLLCELKRWKENEEEKWKEEEGNRKRGGEEPRDKKNKKFLFFFFTFVTIGGWMYYKGILGYSFVIITF